MNFFRTLQASRASWDDLKAAILRRRAPYWNRRDLPAEADLIAFIDRLDDEDFHRLLVICGAFMAKSRGWDVFNLPHPPK